MFTTGSSDVDGRPVTWRHRPGTGPTVVMLHGGLADGRTFDGVSRSLPVDWDLWTIDRRGHGRTPDSPDPFGYADMVTETVGVLDTVSDGPVHLVGHSDGAALALLLAIEHPGRVRSVSAFSANTDPSGYQEGSVSVAAMVAGVGPTYAQVSPDGIGHFPVVVEKVFALWATEPRITPAELASIACPVLVAAGADDVVQEGHTRAIAAAVPGARLEVVPATTHMLVEERPVVCARLVAETIARATH